MTDVHVSCSNLPSGVVGSMGVLPACTPIMPTSTKAMLSIQRLRTRVLGTKCEMRNVGSGFDDPLTVSRRYVYRGDRQQLAFPPTFFYDLRTRHLCSQYAAAKVLLVVV